MSSKPTSSRSELLDCIRGVAILLIIAFHVATEFPTVDLSPAWLFLRKVAFLGVDAFFPLSGFLITRFLLRRNGPGDIQVFFLRRVVRIVPLYLLANLFYFAGAAAMGQGDELREAWIPLLFLTGWMILVEGKEAIPFTITWSLSVEEFAYLLVGLSFLWLRRRATLAVLAIGLAALLVRLWLLTEGHPFNLIYSFPPARLDSIALGALTAIALDHKRHQAMLAGLGLGLAAQIGLALLSPLAFKMLLFPAIATAVSMLIVIFTCYLPNFRSRPTAVLAAIGRLAYFIYLFHYFAIRAIEILFDRAGLVPEPLGMMLGATILTWGAAWLSWRWFEGPLIMRAQALEPSLMRSRAAGPVSQSAKS